MNKTDLIFNTALCGVEHILERRNSGLGHPYDDWMCINLGRVVGHTTAAIKLYDHFWRHLIDVRIVTDTMSQVEELRRLSNKLGIPVTRSDVMSRRSMLNPNRWRGVSFRRLSIFILDGTMHSVYDTLRQFNDDMRMSLMYLDKKEMPIFIGLGMN